MFAVLLVMAIPATAFAWFTKEEGPLPLFDRIVLGALWGLLAGYALGYTLAAALHQVAV